MLNAVFFLSNNYAHFNTQQGLSNENKIHLSYLIDDFDKQKIKAAYSFFSSHEIVNFSLTVIVHTELTTINIENIISFFFIPSYYRINNKIVINLQCNNKGIFENTRNSIIDFSAKQAIDNLTVVHLKEFDDKANVPEVGIHYIFRDTNFFLDSFSKMLNSATIYNNWFYLYDSQTDPATVLLLCRKKEEEQRNLHPEKFCIADKMKLLSDENIVLQTNNNAITSELDNNKKHLEIMRSGHEAKILQHYYNTEYEMLPLWYKQFGHIIKVMMGKRSFRSLFNDKVKKYKD